MLAVLAVLAVLLLLVFYRFGYDCGHMDGQDYGRKQAQKAGEAKSEAERFFEDCA